MKKLLLPLTLVFLIGACRYKDGPGLSLRSAKARVSNTWLMKKCYENGVDKTEDFNTYTLTSTGFFAINESGTWSFNDEKTEINLRKDGTGTNKWTITRLTNKEMWAQQRDQDSALIQYRLVAE